jgi:hypothetical protein
MESFIPVSSIRSVIPNLSLCGQGDTACSGDKWGGSHPRGRGKSIGRKGSNRLKSVRKGEASEFNNSNVESAEGEFYAAIDFYDDPRPARVSQREGHRDKYARKESKFFVKNYGKGDLQNAAKRRQGSSKLKRSRFSAAVTGNIPVGDGTHGLENSSP